MKYKFEIKEISKDTALSMIQKYHYSNTLPKINKYFLGFFLENKLVGVITLGWGTRPKHTIKKLFPSLDTEDYLEIGRMCMTEEMPRNSETQMISQLIKWIRKNIPSLKVLFTWADGMLGKAGYVYQAANFIYAGYSDTDIYLLDGYKIHPRQCGKLFKKDKNDTRVTVRPTREQMKIYDIDHYRGRQYRYFYILDRRYKRRLLEEVKDEIVSPMPKEKDLVWKVLNKNTWKWEACGKPPYQSDFYEDKGYEKIKKILNEKETSI